jgi:hypothetical protein
VIDEVTKFMKEQVYETTIPRNVRLAEAPSHGKPIASYDKASRGAEAFDRLAREFLKRNGSPFEGHREAAEGGRGGLSPVVSQKESEIAALPAVARNDILNKENLS